MFYHLNKYITKLLVVLCLNFSFNLNAQEINPISSKPFTIVIDPGHGGHDKGCHAGSHIHEKNINLEISNMVVQELRHKYPHFNIIETRTEDIFVPLHQRAQIANTSQADLFISVHCNSVENASQVRGSETYVMGLHSAEENLAIAKRENSSIYLEENGLQAYGNFDLNSDEGHILMSMAQSAHTIESLELASVIEEGFANHKEFRSRGVKQAGFVVLYMTAMPSVLVEMGYATNKYDRVLLTSDYGKQEIANILTNAIESYIGTDESPIEKYYVLLTGLAKLDQIESDLAAYDLEPILSNGSYHWRSPYFDSQDEAYAKLNEYRELGFEDVQVVKLVD